MEKSFMISEESFAAAKLLEKLARTFSHFISLRKSSSVAITVVGEGSKHQVSLVQEYLRSFFTEYFEFRKDFQGGMTVAQKRRLDEENIVGELQLKLNIPRKCLLDDGIVVKKTYRCKILRLQKSSGVNCNEIEVFLFRTSTSAEYEKLLELLVEYEEILESEPDLLVPNPKKNDYVLFRHDNKLYRCVVVSSFKSNESVVECIDTGKQFVVASKSSFHHMPPCFFSFPAFAFCAFVDSVDGCSSTERMVSKLTDLMKQKSDVGAQILRVEAIDKFKPQYAVRILLKDPEESQE